MIHRHRSAAERARRLGSRSEAFLAAAEQLYLTPSETPGPRTVLLAVAVELRLKAYICLARGGAPETHDLLRLASLAGHCGLKLARDQRDLVARLEVGRLGDAFELGEGTAAAAGNDADSPSSEPVVPDEVRALCDAVTAEAPDPRP